MTGLSAEGTRDACTDSILSLLSATTATTDPSDAAQATLLTGQLAQLARAALQTAALSPATADDAAAVLQACATLATCAVHGFEELTLSRELLDLVTVLLEAAELRVGGTRAAEAALELVGAINTEPVNKRLPELRVPLLEASVAHVLPSAMHAADFAGWQESDADATSFRRFRETVVSDAIVEAYELCGFGCAPAVRALPHNHTAALYLNELACVRRHTPTAVALGTQHWLDTLRLCGTTCSHGRPTGLSPSPLGALPRCGASTGS